MATIATATPGKTSFVKEFLNDHPDGTTKTVNEAWQAAGMKGTISHPIISQVRKQLGLTGNLPGKTRKSAKEKSAARLPKTATRHQGKTRFVKDFLGDHPQGNVKAVNEAWAAAGKDGTIGSTLIHKMRSQMGLSGNLRGKPKTAAKEKSAANMPRDSNRYTRQDHVRQGVSQRPSRRQRQSRERGVDGSRIRRDHQRNPRLQGESILGSDGQP